MGPVCRSRDVSLETVSVSSGCCNKVPQTGGLNRHGFLSVLEAGSSRPRFWQMWCGGSPLLPHVTAFLLHPQEAGSQAALGTPPARRALILPWDPTFRTSATLSHLPKAPSPGAIMLGGGHKHSVRSRDQGQPFRQRDVNAGRTREGQKCVDLNTQKSVVSGQPG